MQNLPEKDEGMFQEQYRGHVMQWDKPQGPADFSTRVLCISPPNLYWGCVCHSSRLLFFEQQSHHSVDGKKSKLHTG